MPLWRPQRRDPMTEGKVIIVFSTYNSADYAGECLRSCLAQSYENLSVIIADDGSSDNTLEVLKEEAGISSALTLISLPHGERGIARKKAMDEAERQGCDFIYIIDSDMILQEDLVEKCLNCFDENPGTGALVIPELAWSEGRNFYSRVKVFERNIINNAGTDVGSRSIEAARFWKMEEYGKTGGINPHQIAFEETQPTIRYIESGGHIKRAIFTGVKHNEKRVTLRELLKKKKYYFNQIDKTLSTESRGFSKALSRWYFFRPVLYRGGNILRYIRHPLLALGMFNMYFLLSFTAAGALLHSRLRKGKRENRTV